jgi:hypothetical protein
MATTYEVKLISRMAGPSGNHAPGATVFVTREQAIDLIKGNHALAKGFTLEQLEAPVVEAPAAKAKA